MAVEKIDFSKASFSSWECRCKVFFWSKIQRQKTHHMGKHKWVVVSNKQREYHRTTRFVCISCILVFHLKLSPVLKISQLDVLWPNHSKIQSLYLPCNLPDVMPASVPQKSNRSFQSRSNIDMSKTITWHYYTWFTYYKRPSLSGSKYFTYINSTDFSVCAQNPEGKGTCSRLPTLTSVEWNNACYILIQRKVAEV